MFGLLAAFAEQDSLNRQTTDINCFIPKDRFFEGYETDMLDTNRSTICLISRQNATIVPRVFARLTVLWQTIKRR